jgi:hypothetical protein
MLLSFGRTRANLTVLTLFVAMAVVACESSGDAHASEPLAPPQEAKGTTPVNVLWFGHSLVQRAGERAGDPPMDLPALVDDLHRAARADGRTSIPESHARAHVLQSRHLGHHLEGEALAQLKAAKGQGITHVVGIGYMHMLGQRSFDYATITYWLSRLSLAGYDSARSHTEHIYRFVEAMRRELPEATWVNYVGPALVFNKGPQPSIDARHACIERYGRQAGTRVLSAPVGRAIRNAEDAAQKRPELAIKLQLDDGLHLAPQGAVLAASVLYRSIYGVDPVGLAIPEPLARALAETPEQQAKVARFLQEVARDTVASYAPPCATPLPEDEAFLERAGQ